MIVSVLHLAYEVNKEVKVNRGLREVSRYGIGEDEGIGDDEMNNEQNKEENKGTFFARLEGMYVPSEILKIKLAYMLAKYGHRGQERKELDREGRKVRYFEHFKCTPGSIDINGYD